MNNCSGNITKNFIPNTCDNPPVNGVEPLIVIINRDDWLSSTITVDSTNKNLITAITLPSGKKGYALKDVKGKYIKPGYEPSETSFGTAYKHKVECRIYSNTPEDKKEIDTMTKGLYVILVENKDKGVNGNSAIEVYGMKTGLKMVAPTRDVHDKESGGATILTFESDEDGLEPMMPATLFKTDYATTKAAFNALYTV